MQHKWNQILSFGILRENKEFFGQNQGCGIRIYIDIFIIDEYMNTYTYT